MWPLAAATAFSLTSYAIASSHLAGTSHDDVTHRRSLRTRNIVTDGSISDSYDFIIVGGGTAGLVLAARLSEDSNTTVLVLEAGESGDDVVDTINVPDSTYFDSLTQSEYDWAYNTAAQSEMSDRTLSWPRGKVLGGSSAINGMYHVRPAQVEVEAWQALIAAEGDTDADNWSWDSFFAAMKKSETFTPPSDQALAAAGITYDSSLHGTDGPIHVSYPGFELGLNGNWTSTLAAVGVSSRTDGAGGENWGAYITQSFINPSNWTRSYTRSAYIDPLPPRSNLDILPSAYVTQIVFETNSDTGNLTATGVKYAASADDTASTVSVNKEVILAAGVIGSPQVLMVSGIGPKDVLSSAGVDVQYALPGVGQHLQDHLVAAMYWTTSAETAGALYAAGQDDAEFLSYINSATAYVNLTALMGEEDATDLVSNITASASTSTSLVPSTDDTVIAGYSAMYEQAVKLLSTEVGNIELLLALTSDGSVGIQAGLQHPFSPGRVYINSSSVFDYPVIDPGYLTHSADIVVMREGMKMVRKIGETAPLSKYLTAETTPGSSVSSDAEWEAWIKSSATTEYHPHGSNSMLPLSQGGVVNGKLQVYGTDNVRIADSSIFPIDMSCHLEAPTIGVAEKAADIIRAQYNEASSSSSATSSSTSTTSSPSSITSTDNTDGSARNTVGLAALFASLAGLFFL